MFQETVAKQISVVLVFPTKMEHFSIRHLFSGLFCAVLVCLPSSYSAQASTQADIDKIANNLEIKILVTANHFFGDNYTIAFQLKNLGRQTILHTNDWQILFSLNDPGILTQPQFTVHGFTIAPFNENFYTMSSSATFPGLMAGQAFKITTIATGLSTSKFDFQPRFIIRSPTNTIHKTIESTNDDNLDFVQLIQSTDKTNPTKGTLSAIDRATRLPEPLDMTGVAPTLVIPRPVQIEVNRDVPLIDLGLTSKFYMIFPTNISAAFKTYFIDSFASIQGVTRNKLFFNEPVTNDGDVVRITIVPGTDQSPAYTLDVAKGAIGGIHNRIEINCTSEEGLNYALQSFKSVLGLYNALPAFIRIMDGPRYEFRSVTLDQSKNFFGLTVLKKFVDLMTMYKLNKLILNLGDDYGWRLQVPTALDIPELITVGSSRCVTGDDCLPPYYGSGANGTTTSNGYLTEANFVDLIRYAKARKVDIIPKFNFFGGLLPAKRAAHIRYQRLQPTDQAEANRLHLNQGIPAVPTGTKLKDKWSFNGLMDHCSAPTMAFIDDMIQGLVKIYNRAQIPFVGLHAGGDELTQYLEYFPSCNGLKGATVLRNSLVAIRNFLPPATNLHVNEEVITDYSNGHMIEEVPNSAFRTSNQVVHFKKTFVDDLDKLSPAQKTFLFAEVPPFPDETNPNAVPDPMKPYTGIRRTSAPWLLPYRCANKGYKIVMEPENFYGLHSAYEVDYEEPGKRNKEVAHFISLHRLMASEPENMYINMDLTKDGQALLQYRLCKVHTCVPLSPAGKMNFLGIGATIDTSIIRTPALLWHMTLPRLLMFAEKAWRQPEYENLLKAEDPTTLVDPERLAFRTNQLVINMQMFSNTLAYKELGRLEAGGYLYRICRLGASILLGLQFGQKPPYPVVVKCDIPTPNIEYMDMNSRNKTWQPLFTFDPRSQALLGGYEFSFPGNREKILTRVASPEGTRGGKPTLIDGDIRNYLPQEIPIDMREGACLSIEQAWNTDIEKVTTKQWKKVLENIDGVLNERRQFMTNREQNLTTELAKYNTGRQGLTLPGVFGSIQQLLSRGEDINTLPTNSVLYAIHKLDSDIYRDRERFVENRYSRWQQQYVNCNGGTTSVRLSNPNAPIAPGGPIPHVPRGPPGGGQPGLPTGTGGSPAGTPPGRPNF